MILLINLCVCVCSCVYVYVCVRVCTLYMSVLCVLPLSDDFAVQHVRMWVFVCVCVRACMYMVYMCALLLPLSDDFPDILCVVYVCSYVYVYVYVHVRACMHIPCMCAVCTST
jgi:hypothetical protein